MQFKATLVTLALAGSALARASATTAAPTPQETCLNACADGDVMCQAACVGTAHPDPDQANATIQCVRDNCDQGNGSPAASMKYSQCVQQCIDQNFPTSQSVPGGVPAPTVAPSSLVMSSVMPTPSGSNPNSGSNGGSNSNGGSSGGNGDSQSSGDGSGNAASSNFKAGASFGAVAAVVLAALML